MIKIVGSMGCYDVSFESDPYVPLTISWQVGWGSVPLCLYVRGEDQGYVELKVDVTTLALCKVVVVELPRQTDRRTGSLPQSESNLSPVLDRSHWEWKVTPDYAEPAGYVAETTERLSCNRSSGTFIVWFSEAASIRYLACGDVKVGVSAESDLVCVAVPTPPAVEPKGYPRSPV